MPIIGRGGVVAHEISAPGMGSGGTSTDDWTRPADWITLPNSVGFFGQRSVLPWAPADDHSAMWDHLLQCLDGDAEPIATAEHAAGAVGDLWRCYEAAGITL